jgi:hypothetical protein
MSAFTEHLKSLGSEVEEEKGLQTDPAVLGKKELTQDEVQTWWNGLQGQSLTGWAQFSDANIRLHHEKPSSARSPLLAAEFLIGKTSYQLRLNGSSWHAVALTRTNKPNAWIEKRSYLADKEGKTVIQYEVEWSAPLDQPLRPKACRLVGLTTSES